MLVFSLELKHVKCILEALRALENPSKDETICWFKQQIAGKIKKLEPFMRERKWIEDEIKFESKSGSRDAKCSNCQNPSRSKYCAICWKEILTCFHDVQGHLENCKAEYGK